MGETHEGVHRSFNATTRYQLPLLRRVVGEFVGITLIETESETPGDFMTHVDLSFTSEEQAEEFEARRQMALREEHSHRRIN